MNKIYPLLPSSNVVFIESVHHTTKKRVFEEASLIFQMYGVPHTDIFEALFARERLGNNSLGGGVYLPHCRLEGLTRPLAAVVILQRPIHMDPKPIDTKPVDIFFFLVVPDTDNDDQNLPLLRECIAMLENKSICAQLRQATNAVEVCSALMSWQPPTALQNETEAEELSKEWDLLNDEVQSEHARSVEIDTEFEAFLTENSSITPLEEARN